MVSERDENGKREWYVILYTLLMLLAVTAYLYRTFGFFHLCLRISRNLHNQLLRGIIRAKMHFFYVNSFGRIINRFTKDISSVDVSLPEVIVDFADVRNKGIRQSEQNGR